MDAEVPSTASSPSVAGQVDHSTVVPSQNAPAQEGSPMLPASGITSWAKNLKIPQFSVQDDSETGNAGKSAFSRFASGFGLRTPTRTPTAAETNEGNSAAAESGVLGSLTKGLVDSSKSAVRAVQTKARHMVSQNKRRYQVCLI